MRIDKGAFAEISESQRQAPQFVVSVNFGDNDLFYLTWHAIAGLAGENVIEGVLVSMSGTSQKLNPDKANSEIGFINFEVLTTNGFEPYQYPNVASAVAAGRPEGRLAAPGGRRRRIRDRLLHW